MENEVISVNFRWWFAHIKPKDPIWIEEGVKESDQYAKEMLHFIEQSHVSNKMLNKPALIAHVKEIFLRHQCLADVYIELAKELYDFEDTFPVSRYNTSLLTPNAKMENEVISVNLRWWCAHIRPRDPIWIEEGLKESDQNIKEMIQLIEQSHVSNKQLNKPALIAHAKQIFLRHQCLADVYIELAKELYSCKDTFTVSHKNTPLLTPNAKMEDEVISVNLRWWFAHIRPSDPMWTEEGVKESNQYVKEMLQLIEQSHVGNIKLNKPALIAHVKEIFLRHQRLADADIELAKELYDFEDTFPVSRYNTSLLMPNAKMENEVISVNLRWWYAHIRPKDPIWIEEGLKESDQHIKEMIQLIEQSHVSNKQLNKTALIAHAKQIFLRHQCLADVYMELAKELYNCEDTFSVSQKNTSLLTPNAKMEDEVISVNLRWWFAHIKPDDPIWTEEGLKESNQYVKEMLQLIEQSHISNKKLNKPALIAHVNEIFLRHQRLADADIELAKALYDFEDTFPVSRYNTSLLTPNAKMENEVISVNLRWWYAHIRPKGSIWIEEGLKESDQHIKEMIQLIEQSHVSNKQLNKTALIAHAKQIFLRHQCLADVYMELAKELFNCEDTFSVSQKNTSLLTLNTKQSVDTVQGQVVNSHGVPSSNGGIYDVSSNAYSGSSSDSDSESLNSSSNECAYQVKHKRHDATRIEDHEVLMQRIADYEKELKVSNQKLQIAEEEIAKLKIQLKNN